MIPETQHSETIFKDQSSRFWVYLFENTATMTMASRATGIPQKNLCRYKREYEKMDALWEVERKPCEVTGFPAWYLTTNKGEAPTDKPQLTLF